MDNRIIEMLLLVYEINKMGGELVFELRRDEFSIHDTKKGCENIIANTDLGQDGKRSVYFEEWFKDSYEECVDTYLKVLNEMKEELNND